MHFVFSPFKYIVYHITQISSSYIVIVSREDLIITPVITLCL